MEKALASAREISYYNEALFRGRDQSQIIFLQNSRAVVYIRIFTRSLTKELAHIIERRRNFVGKCI